MTLTDCPLFQHMNAICTGWSGARYLTRFVGGHPDISLSGEMKDAAYKAMNGAGSAAKESVRWSVGVFFHTAPGRLSLRGLDWLLSAAERNLLPVPALEMTARALTAPLAAPAATNAMVQTEDGEKVEGKTAEGEREEHVVVSLIDRSMQTDAMQGTDPTESTILSDTSCRVYRTQSCPEVNLASAHLHSPRRSSVSRPGQTRRPVCYPASRCRGVSTRRATTPSKSVARVRPTSRHSPPSKTDDEQLSMESIKGKLSMRMKTGKAKTQRCKTTSTPKGNWDFSFSDPSFDEFDDFSSVQLTSNVLEYSDKDLEAHEDIETSEGFYHLAWAALNEAADDYEVFLEKEEETISEKTDSSISAVGSASPSFKTCVQDF